MTSQSRFNQLVEMEVRCRKLRYDSKSTLCDCMDATEAVTAACCDSDGQLDVALLKRVEFAADRFVSRL